MNMTGLCMEIKNWFEVDKRLGVFKIENGSLTFDDLQEGQFFRIIGSVFNDGVYQYPVSDLTDETFDGAIWPMAVPPDVQSLLTEISNWLDTNADVLNSPFQSESFGGYSCSKASGNSKLSDGSITWQSHFANELNKWRKI